MASAAGSDSNKGTGLSKHCQRLICTFIKLCSKSCQNFADLNDMPTSFISFHFILFIETFVNQYTNIDTANQYNANNKKTNIDSSKKILTNHWNAGNNGAPEGIRIPLRGGTPITR